MLRGHFHNFYRDILWFTAVVPAEKKATKGRKTECAKAGCMATALICFAGAGER